MLLSLPLPIPYWHIPYIQRVLFTFNKIIVGLFISFIMKKNIKETNFSIELMYLIHFLFWWLKLTAMNITFWQCLNCFLVWWAFWSIYIFLFLFCFSYKYWICISNSLEMVYIQIIWRLFTLILIVNENKNYTPVLTWLVLV